MTTTNEDSTNSAQLATPKKSQIADAISLETMKVDQRNVARLVQRLGKDCSSDQWFREYLKNALEACQRRGLDDMVITIDCAWDLLKKGFTSVPKLSITDTGVSMTPDEIKRNMNGMAASGDKNEHVNYGVGAKIAGAVKNHEGIIIQAWQNGQGHLAILKYDAAPSTYGLERMPTGDGKYSSVLAIDDELLSMPEDIKKRGGFGTRITFLGMSADENTMDPPVSQRGGRDNWLVYLGQTRFYKYPEGIKVQMRVRYYDEDVKHNYLKSSPGAKHDLEKNSIQSGSVSVNGANIEWFLLKEGRQGHGRSDLKGYIALRNEDELLDRSNRKNRFAVFGIPFGQKDIVLVVEPLHGVAQNTSRTVLIDENGEPIQIEQWASEWRQKAPQPIRDHIANEMSKSESQSNGESILKRLKKYQNLYQIPRYLPKSGGVESIDRVDLFVGNTGHPRNGLRKRKPLEESRPSSGCGTGSTSTRLAARISSNAKIKASPSQSSPFPTFHWVSKAEGNRDANDLEDRAASFYRENFLIKGNKDFVGFQSVIGHFVEEYSGIELPGIDVEACIVKTVLEHFEQLLIEVVAGTVSLEGRACWSYDDAESALSDEALTASVSPRYSIMREISRSLREQLGASSGIKSAENS